MHEQDSNDVETSKTLAMLKVVKLIDPDRVALQALVFTKKRVFQLSSALDLVDEGSACLQGLLQAAAGLIATKCSKGQSNFLVEMFKEQLAYEQSFLEEHVRPAESRFPAGKIPDDVKEGLTRKYAKGLNNVGERLQVIAKELGVEASYTVDYD